MSLDLEHEIIAEVKQLPLMMEAHNVSSPPPPPTTATMGVDNGGCHLTEVGGRLGVAIATSQRGTTDVEVYHCFCVILTN